MGGCETDGCNSQAKKPSLTTHRKNLYFQSPPQLNDLTKPNLVKKLRELVDDGEEVSFGSCLIHTLLLMD